MDSTQSGKSRRRRGTGTTGRSARGAAWSITFFLLAVALLVAIAGTLQMMAPVSGDKNARPVLVTIPRGANTREIGGLLARRHLIRKPLAFVLGARLEGVGSKMRAGHYELSPAMPPRQMAALIALGETATDVVTVPEGFTVSQIARRLAEKRMGNENTFLTLAQTQGTTFRADGWQPPDANLEGYLFPDTYRFPKGMTEREIIAQMLDNFHKRVVVPHKAEIAAYPGGLPALINLASLVEREAEVDKDRPLIAAALQNRLKIGMRLQCDATIQYALPEHKSRLHYVDLRVDSSYNSYTHAGLPPTPIANPGLPSIEAALHPAAVDYLFYVARPDGSHIFSRTLAEHDRAIADLRAQRG